MVNNNVEQKVRRASGTISNIQTRYCGQAAQDFGAISFKNLDSTVPVDVSKSVFMNSDTYAVVVSDSHNINFDHNVVINSARSGV